MIDFRALLRSRNLTQRAAAKLCAVSIQTIWRIEHGIRPRLGTRLKIMRALGLKGAHTEIFGPLPRVGRISKYPPLPGESPDPRGYMRRRRDCRVAAGNCEDCGRPREPEGSATRCVRCRDDHNEIARDYQRRKAAQRRAS